MRKAEFFLYGLILVMNRLAAPWQLIRIATRAAESDDTARVAETPYAAAVTLVLGEAENMVGELRSEIRAGRPIVSMLKAIHDAARGLRSEMDLSVESPWSRQLAAIRAEVSSMLKAEIEATPGFVRRLLRPRPAKDIVPGSLLDSIDVNEAEMRVEFVGACRQYAERTRGQRSDDARPFRTDALSWRPAPRFCSIRCAMPATPIGRSGNPRSMRRSGFAEPCSAPNMRVSSPKPPRSRCRPEPPSVGRLGHERSAASGSRGAVRKISRWSAKLPRRGSHCGRIRAVL